eukprot:TRINITY_DN8616_c0_g1_i2.p1 TRINITY_DN8616_c0_g1~~TRINITY_DN8616_c0_g1_i2.p1  ORF type:complete len:1331 (-),score=160.48 TRINITY_DN8616_c0_g1_i2:156-4148(-)
MEHHHHQASPQSPSQQHHRSPRHPDFRAAVVPAASAATGSVSAGRSAAVPYGTSGLRHSTCPAVLDPRGGTTPVASLRSPGRGPEGEARGIASAYGDAQDHSARARGHAPAATATTPTRSPRVEASAPPGTASAGAREAFPSGGGQVQSSPQPQPGAGGSHSAEAQSQQRRNHAKSIGHYILGKTIGEGTFGKVKLGTHILTSEKVAVKVLEKERIVDVADVERVAREVYILKLIRHQHVVQLYEIIETSRQLYLIMEYAAGGELFDYIVNCVRIPELEACRFFQQIIEGVKEIHKMNVVHRDLKPENLLLDEHRHIKIVDFGLSNTYRDGQLLKTACGSPCYAAPEMIAGKEYVPSLCDIWSCGVILFAMLCGYLPFEDQNTSALYRKILAAEYTLPEFLSPEARDLISRMLTTDPTRRFTESHIRKHAWFNLAGDSSASRLPSTQLQYFEEDILEELEKFGFPPDYILRCLRMNKHNHVTTTYHLLAQKKRRMMEQVLTDREQQSRFEATSGLDQSTIGAAGTAPSPSASSGIQPPAGGTSANASAGGIYSPMSPEPEVRRGADECYTPPGAGSRAVVSAGGSNVHGTPRTTASPATRARSAGGHAPSSAAAGGGSPATGQFAGNAQPPGSRIPMAAGGVTDSSQDQSRGVGTSAGVANIAATAAAEAAALRARAATPPPTLIDERERVATPPQQATGLPAQLSQQPPSAQFSGMSPRWGAPLSARATVPPLGTASAANAAVSGAPAQASAISASGASVTSGGASGSRSSHHTPRTGTRDNSQRRPSTGPRGPSTDRLLGKPASDHSNNGAGGASTASTASPVSSNLPASESITPRGVRPISAGIPPRRGTGDSSTGQASSGVVGRLNGRIASPPRQDSKSSPGAVPSSAPAATRTAPGAGGSLSARATYSMSGRSQTPDSSTGRQNTPLRNASLSARGASATKTGVTGHQVPQRQQTPPQSLPNRLMPGLGNSGGSADQQPRTATPQPFHPPQRPTTPQQNHTPPTQQPGADAGAPQLQRLGVMSMGQSQDRTRVSPLSTSEARSPATGSSAPGGTGATHLSRPQQPSAPSRYGIGGSGVEATSPGSVRGVGPLRARPASSDVGAGTSPLAPGTAAGRIPSRYAPTGSATDPSASLYGVMDASHSGSSSQQGTPRWLDRSQQPERPLSSRIGTLPTQGGTHVAAGASEMDASCNTSAPLTPREVPPLSARDGSPVQPLSARDAPMPLSAREAREDRRSAYDTLRTSSRPPRLIMQELQRVMAAQRIQVKQMSPLVLRCQWLTLKFDVEVAALDRMGAVHAVRSRRTAGEPWQFKDVCNRLLAELRIA